MKQKKISRHKKMHDIPISVVINKVLLKRSHTDLLSHCLWLLLLYKDRAE